MEAWSSEKFLIIDFPSFLCNLISTFIFATARNIVLQTFSLFIKVLLFPYSLARYAVHMWAWGNVYDPHVHYFHGTLMFVWLCRMLILASFKAVGHVFLWRLFRVHKFPSQTTEKTNILSLEITSISDFQYLRC